MPGSTLTEDTICTPDTLYGTVKLAGEAALARCHPAGISLRATGVYGPPAPGQRHKWADLFEAFAAGERLPPRIGTEVHGEDLATAVRLALTVAEPGPLNVSDLCLDRRDMLALWSEVSGCAGHLPERSDSAAVNAMDTSRLRALGWRPGGMAKLHHTLVDLARR